jgi:hypothetical protein
LRNDFYTLGKDDIAADTANLEDYKKTIFIRTKIKENLFDCESNKTKKLMINIKIDMILASDIFEFNLTSKSCPFLSRV